jgi:hypothetical protein
MRRRLWPLLGMFLALALLRSASAQSPPPNVTGSWSISTRPNDAEWHFTASGPGLSQLSGSWTPARSKARGTFSGSLHQSNGASVYSGTETVSDPPQSYHWPMSLTILGPNTMQGNVDGAPFTLTRHGCSGCNSGPVKINVNYYANNLPTFPPADGGQCPLSPAGAMVAGHLEAQITPQGATQGGGVVSATPHRSRCRVPVINFAVDRIRVEALTPSRIIRATMQVHISSEGVHQPGQCLVGTTGTIVATYDDTAIAANSSPRVDQLRIGPWSAPCNAHNHVITNNITSIPAHAGASTWVTVFIGCVAPGTGYAPRNCT